MTGTLAQSLLLEILGIIEKREIPYAVLTPCTGEPPKVSSDVDLALVSDPRSTIEPILVELQALGKIEILHRLDYEVPAGYVYIMRISCAPDLQLLHLDCLFDPSGICRLGLHTPAIVAGRVREWWGYRAGDLDLASYFLRKRAVKVGWLKLELPEDRFCAIQELLRRVDRKDLAREAERLLGGAAGLVQTLMAAPSRALAEPTLARFWRVWWTRRWRAHPLRWLQRNLLETLRFCYLSLHVTGLFVVLLGPDGCGKSTLAELLGDRFATTFRRIWRFHWRPGLLPKLSRKSAAPAASRAPEPPGRPPTGKPSPWPGIFTTCAISSWGTGSWSIRSWCCGRW